MIKHFTGREIDPDEFKKLNYCIQCSRATDAKYGELCTVCIPLSKCEICEICLREGEYEFYIYDNRDEFRDRGFNAIKEYIREFIYINTYPKLLNDKLCNSCINWESKLKFECAKCGIKFSNCKQHFKDCGNICETCCVKQNYGKN